MRAETLSNLSFLAMDGGAKCPYFTLPQVSQGCRDFSSSAPPLSREVRFFNFLPMRHTAVGSTNKIIQTSPTASSTLTKGSISKYLCGDCDGQFLHRQSLLRHRKSVHNKAHRFCWYCNFKWTRPYEYKNHLKKRHPSADIVKVLGKRPGSRRTSLIMARDLAPHISPPAVEPNHQSQAERPQRSVTPPLPAAHVPAPALSGAAHDSRPEYADSTVTSRNYWVVQLTNDVFEDRKNWSVHVHVYIPHM